MDIIFKKVGSGEEKHTAERYIDAYLRLFNCQDNLKYLSLTGIPFQRETVEAWLRDADDSGVEYLTAVGKDGEIFAIMCTGADLLNGCEIMALVVGHEHRRTGIGGRLIEMAVERAGERGFKCISASVFADNKRMISLLIKNDFKPYRIDAHARWDGEDIVRLSRYI